MRHITRAFDASMPVGNVGYSLIYPEEYWDLVIDIFPEKPKKVYAQLDTNLSPLEKKMFNERVDKYGGVCLYGHYVPPPYSVEFVPIDQRSADIMINGVSTGLLLLGNWMNEYERTEDQERTKRIQEENAKRKKHNNPILPPSSYEEIEQRKRLQSVLGRCASQEKPDRKRCENMVMKFLKKDPKVVQDSIKFNKLPEGDNQKLVDVEYYFILNSGKKSKMTGAAKWYIRLSRPSSKRPDGIIGFSRSMEALGYSESEKALAGGVYNAGRVLNSYLYGVIDEIRCEYMGSSDRPREIAYECKRVTESSDRMELRNILVKYIKETSPNSYTANCLRAAIYEGGAR